MDATDRKKKMNRYNPHIHHRRSIRLKGYDYSQAGLYFITVCVQNRECLFGRIANREMILNDAGTMVQNEWLKLPERFKNIRLHEYVVMPNHFHAILEIVVGATLVVAQNATTDQNINADQNINVEQNNVVALNNDVAQNTNVVQNNVDALNNDVAQNMNIDQNNVVAVNNDAEQNDPTDRNIDDVQIGRPQGHAPTDTPKNKTVGDMMGAFQSIVTVEYIRGVKTLGWQPFNGKLWQRNYWEHIIRNEQSYQTISDYIINNPHKWNDDKFYTR